MAAVNDVLARPDLARCASTAHEAVSSVADPLAAAIAGDLDRGFESFVLAYQDRAFAFALGLLRDRLLAQDVVQDAFVRAYRALKTYDAERIRGLALRAWLMRIVHNLALNARRGAGRTTSLDDVDADRDPRVADVHTALDDVVRGDENRRLRAAVDALPERYRAAVVLRHLDDCSYDEIASILGQPAGTVKANVHRGLARLRISLHDPTGEA